MKIKSIIFLIFVFFNHPLYANYPNYENPFVNDWANLLDAESEKSIAQSLQALKIDTQIKIVLVTIDRISDYPNTANTIEGFGLNLFTDWIGNKNANDGILVLISHYDRDMHITIGTDYDDTDMNQKAEDIIDNYFNPSFKEDAYQHGIEQGMKQLIVTLNPNTLSDVSFLETFYHSAQHAISNTFLKSWGMFICGLVLFVGFLQLNSLTGLIRKIFTRKRDKTYSGYVLEEQETTFVPVIDDDKNTSSMPIFVVIFFGTAALISISIYVGKNEAMVGTYFLLLGTGIAYSINKIKDRMRNKAKTCPNCNHLMVRVDEANDDDYLEYSEKLEESLRSVDYDVWLCNNCKEVKKVAYPYSFSSIRRCKKCNNQTIEKIKTVLRAPTKYSEGSGSIYLDCKYCNYYHESSYTIPKIPDDD